MKFKKPAFIPFISDWSIFFSARSVDYISTHRYFLYYINTSKNHVLVHEWIV